MASDTERALRLLAQIEQQYAMEEAIGIDHDDNDRFSARELLMVADGEATIEGLVWGTGGPPSRDEELAKLAAWNAAARR